LSRQQPEGQLLRRGEPGYEEARLGAVWNSRKPSRHPDCIFRAASAEAVAWAVRLAISEGLQVSVRSGGHSWYGNSVRDGGLLIDLSQLCDVSIDPQAKTAAVGPALTGRAFDAALAAHDLCFPIGHCGTVGIGGFVLGGGYGWNSRVYGPACLSLRAVDVVLANGELVHADDASHPDLLWAARGAGPGFFGVVTRFYLQVYPRPRVTRIGQVYPLELHDEVISWGLELLPRLPANVEMSLRVGHSPALAVPTVSVTALAFAERDGDPDGDALLREVESNPLLARALAREQANPDLLPDLNNRGGDGAPVLRWDVDGVWTDATTAEILPAAAAAGLGAVPSADCFVLWMLWGQHPTRENACWSMQAPLYLSPNAGWSDAADDARHLRWVDGALSSLADFSRGVQFSDANLAARHGQGLTPENAKRVEEIRAIYDPERRFFPHMSPA
jgi:FAD/FMN-containing dehydrogenase